MTTAITANPGQKRLDSCVLMLHKWAKTQQKLRTRECGTRKINNLVANTKLLEKYRVNALQPNR